MFQVIPTAAIPSRSSDPTRQARCWEQSAQQWPLVGSSTPSHTRLPSDAPATETVLVGVECHATIQWESQYPSEPRRTQGWCAHPHLSKHCGPHILRKPQFPHSHSPSAQWSQPSCSDSTYLSMANRGVIWVYCVAYESISKTKGHKRVPIFNPVLDSACPFIAYVYCFCLLVLVHPSFY